MDRLRNGLICLFGVSFLGVLALTWLEPDLTFWKACYFVIVTVSTVGFGDITPQTDAGRTVTALLIVSGITAATYAGGGLIQLLTEGHFRRVLGYRRLTKQIQNLSDHFIICGCGRIGSRVANECRKAECKFVVLDLDPERLAEQDAEGVLVLAGDATEEEVLEEAGIHRAAGLVTVLPSDAENVFITLTARDLNKNLFIVARGENQSTVKKLQRAGANRIVSPSNVTALRVFNSLIRPSIVDFLEVVTGSEDLSLEAAEFVIPHHHDLVAQSLRKADVRGRCGVLVLGIRRAEGQFFFNPDPDETIREGDMLLVAGEPIHLETFRSIYQL